MNVAMKRRLLTSDLEPPVSSVSEQQPMRARHCQVCKRCVRRFDHHCPWMENCVGERNHRWFIVYLLVQLLALLWAFGVALYDSLSLGGVGGHFLSSSKEEILKSEMCMWRTHELNRWNAELMLSVLVPGRGSRPA